MAKAPPGVPDVIAPELEPDERLIAATFADNRSVGEQTLGDLTGELGVKVVRVVGTRTEVPPLPGLAGKVRHGEVLVAATDRRMLVFLREGKQLFTPPIVYDTSPGTRA
jgi:hypothetical protein